MTERDIIEFDLNSFNEIDVITSCEMSRKRKSMSHKEQSTNPNEDNVDENLFKISTSKFNYIEEEALRIKIIPATFSELMDTDGLIESEDLPQTVKDLYLEEMTPNKIMTFDPDEHPEMNETMYSFLVKLKIVLRNNIQFRDVPREERFIDDMTVDLMRSMKYDDGKEFTMGSCTLKLSVGSRNFAAEADREGRRGTGIIWIMQENKHINDNWYKEGDIQLISCMIAACQANLRITRSIYPEKMLGIKIKGDEMYFYSFCIKEEYITDLSRGVPNEDLEVLKYPDKEGLHISIPVQRKEIISHLWTMRQQALKLRKIKEYTM